MILLLVFLIGVLTGLRSLTPPAGTAWAAHWGWIRAPRFLSWLGATPSVLLLTGLALVELVADKLPKTPNRTQAMPLIARMVMGAFTGACLGANGGQSSIVSALIGALGAVVGTLAGYQARTRLVASHGHDLPIALLEDAVAVLGAFALAAVTAAL